MSHSKTCGVKGGKKPEKESKRVLLEALQERLGYRFQRLEWLREALTHRSLSIDTNGKWSRDQLKAFEFPSASADTQAELWDNERLEFLGDAVLDLIVGKQLFLRPEKLAEGPLSKLRSAHVNTKALAEKARQLCLSECLIMGYGEHKSGGGDRDSNLAGAFEALVGAIFVDGGYEACEGVVCRLFKELEDEVVNLNFGEDFKSSYQEYCQKELGVTPKYKLKNSFGPAHEKTFVIEVSVKDKQGNQITGRGEGFSKKEASKQAAFDSLRQIQENKYN